MLAANKAMRAACSRAGAAAGRAGPSAAGQARCQGRYIWQSMPCSSSAGQAGLQRLHSTSTSAMRARWAATTPRQQLLAGYNRSTWWQQSVLNQASAGSSRSNSAVARFCTQQSEKAKTAAGKAADKAKGKGTGTGRRQLTLPGSESDGLAGLVKGAKDLLPKIARLPLTVAQAVGRGIKIIFTDPARAWVAVKHGFESFKEFLNHYWLGSKLLYSDVKTAVGLLGKLMAGHQLTRRERKRLSRTAADVFRLVPMAIFVLVPFMEFLLPIALRIFPNMLPSTFQSKDEKAANVESTLRMRLRMATFLQDTMQEMADEVAAKAEGDDVSAREFVDVINRMKSGDDLPTDAILKAATLFSDELTLENIERAQLLAMAKYMGVPPFGSDAILRFQLRNHVRTIKNDDAQILWEGIDSLSESELRTACEDRGIRASGVSRHYMRRQLQQWLELSVHKNVPTSLLIMSRAFSITATPMDPEDAIKESISQLDAGLLNEAIVEHASHTGEDDVFIRAMKLKSAEYQEHKILSEAVAEAMPPTELLELAEPAAGADSEKAADSAAHADEIVIIDGVEVPAAAVPERNAAPQVGDVEFDEVSAEILASLLKYTPIDGVRSEYEELKAQADRLEVTQMLARGRIGMEQEDTTSSTRVRGYLDSTLSKLEKELAAVEESHVEASHELDRDHDGMVTSEDIHNAVLRALDAANREDVNRQATASAVVRALDKDGDGIVPLYFVQQIAQQAREAVAGAEAETAGAGAGAGTGKKASVPKGDKSSS